MKWCLIKIDSFKHSYHVNHGKLFQVSLHFIKKKTSTVITLSNKNIKSCVINTKSNLEITIEVLLSTLNTLKQIESKNKFNQYTFLQDFTWNHTF